MINTARQSDTHQDASKHTFSEFTGMEYLMIDVASNYGLEKEDWDVRIQWTKDHEGELLVIASMDEEQLKQFTPELLKEADEPALFYAGVKAWAAARQGKPTGYPISLDATASGMQLLAILAGCEKSARACNVIPSSEFEDHREDAYTSLYRVMKDILDQVRKGTGSLQITDKDTVTRAQAKDAIMTSLYGSTAVPKRHFGTGAMLDIFYQTLEQGIPGAWSLNLGLKNLWQSYALSHDWVLPDNFHVHIKEMNQEQKFVQFLDQPTAVEITVNKGSKEGLSLCPNIIHSIDGMVVREMTRRCDYDRDRLVRTIEAILSGQKGSSTHRPEDQTLLHLWDHYQNSGFLSARVLDVIDERNMGLVDVDVIKGLIRSLPEKPFHIISIHDCFRCLPNYGNDLRRQYNQILSEIAGSHMLRFIASQVVGYLIPVTKGADLSQEILHSDYALS